MSRRQRKKSTSKESKVKQLKSRRKGLWWKLLVVFVVILFAGSIYIYNKAIDFLHGNEFRDSISEQVGAKIGSEVSFGDFKWDGLSAENNSMKASGEGAISSLEVTDLSLDVDLDFVKRDKFTVKNIYLEDVNAEIDLRKKFLTFPLAKKKKSFIESLLPEKVELLDAEINNLNTIVHSDSGDYTISGVKIKAKKEGESYKSIIEGGVANLPFSFLSIARLERGEIVKLDKEIYIKDTTFKIFKNGKITLNGVVDLAPNAVKLYDMKAVLSGLLCKDVFPDSWQRHLSGNVEGQFEISPYRGSEPKIIGELKINNGMIQAFPFLNQVAMRLAEPRYRTIDFQKFSCDFEKFREQIHLKNMILVSDRLVTIEGDLKINGKTLDGVFDVGLPYAHISKIPGATNSVFKSGKNNLYWARVKVSGDFDNIKEDLKDRLIEAAVDAAIKKFVDLGLDPEKIKQLLELKPEKVSQLLKLDPGKMKKLLEDGSNLSNILEAVKKGDQGAIGAAMSILGSLTGKKPPNLKKENDPNKKDDSKKKDDGVIPEIKKIIPFELPF